MSLRLAPVFALLLFTACASSNPQTPEQKASAATDECLTHPALSKTWGSCNVKETIYADKKAIVRCQKKFQKTPEPGQVLNLKIALNETGAVEGVEASPRANAQNRLLESCLAEEIGKLKFAAPPAGTKPTINFPLQLN